MLGREEEETPARLWRALGTGFQESGSSLPPQGPQAGKAEPTGLAVIGTEPKSGKVHGLWADEGKTVPAPVYEFHVFICSQAIGKASLLANK